MNSQGHKPRRRCNVSVRALIARHCRPYERFILMYSLAVSRGCRKMKNVPLDVGLATVRDPSQCKTAKTALSRVNGHQ